MFGALTVTLADWVAIFISVALSLRFFLQERAANRRALALPLPEQKVRDPSDLSSGLALYEVRVASDGRTNLGTSLETTERPSGAPELTTQPVTVETAAGVRLSLRGGAPLKVHLLGGARRNLVESITTDDGGIQQRFSFEVDASTKFLLQGVMPDDASKHPWRTAAIDFMPDAGGYAINPPLESRREFSSMGCLAYPLCVGGVAALLAAESTLWTVVAWVIWGSGAISLLAGASVAKSEFRGPAEPARVSPPDSHR